ncbi:MAG: sugar ABC transporter substrate-binding protein [bacterium]|nr:sugar ABC transporter substrate-binding protein [bacterium]
MSPPLRGVVTRHPFRITFPVLTGCLLLSLDWGCSRRGDEETVILRVANWGSPAVESSFMQLERQIREEFEQHHPGVRVQVEQIPGHGQYVPKLIMMHVSGGMPDVIHLDASSASVFIDNDVVRDLTPYVQQDPAFDLGLYFENVVNIARRQDALYAIPLDFTPMVMYYNKALFDVAGVPYPQPSWTWDEFLDIARRLTVFPTGGQRPTQYGFNFENVMPFWVLWLWTNGGDVLSPDGGRASGYFNDRPSVEAMQFLVDLMLEHRVAPSLAERAAAGVDLFLDGRAAMDLKGHWMMIDYRARDLDVGVVPLPTNNGEPVTVVYEAGLAITQGSRHPDLAWDYIKFMTSKDVQARRVASGLAISANREAAAEFAGDPVEDAFVEAVRFARPPWGARVERYPACEDLGREMMEDIQYGGVPVEEALDRTAGLMDAVLREP